MYVWIITGTVVIWALYCIPVIGFIAAGVVSLLGLGTFAIYLVERYRSNTPRPLPATIAPDDAVKPAAGYSNPLALPSVEPAIVIGPPRAQFLPRLFASIIDLAVLYAMLSSLHLTHAVIPVVGALPVRDVCLEKFDPGRDRFESPGPETGWYLLDRGLFRRPDSRFIESRSR